MKDGTLRIEWRDFPYQGQESVNAALAARAAQDQGRFWEYHDLLYENQSSRLHRGEPGGLAKRPGSTRGGSRATWRAPGTSRCAGGLPGGPEPGISGTPTFVINGQVLVGSQPLEVFEEP